MGLYTVYGPYPVFSLYTAYTVYRPVSRLYTAVYRYTPYMGHTLYLAYIGVYPDLGPVPVLARPWLYRPNSMPNMRIFGYVPAWAHTHI